MSDTRQVLADADHALHDLVSAVNELKANTVSVDASLSRYTFTMLVNAADGVFTPEKFEQLGGLPAVRKAVRILYDKVMADPELALYFEGVDLVRLRQQQVQMFLALFGAKDYESVNLRAAHEEYGISTEYFERMLGHLAEALDEVGMPFEDAEEVVDRVRTFEDQIVREDL